MPTGDIVQKPSRIVPIVVAIVGAVGLIVAAMITSGVFDEDDGAPNDDVTVTTTTDPNGEVQPIDGRYNLDPGNPRIILVRRGEGDTYAISEELPADWPFAGSVSYTGDNTYEGDATFASGDTMNVTMLVMPNDHLDTAFEFTDATGLPTGRVDHHELVPEE